MLWHDTVQQLSTGITQGARGEMGAVQLMGISNFLGSEKTVI